MCLRVCNISVCEYLLSSCESQDADKLDRIKQRPPQKHYIKAVNSLQTLQQFTRVPQKYKKQLRRNHRTTYILPNGHSYRIVKSKKHLLLLNRLKWVYTTSANLSGASYDADFSTTHADITIQPLCNNTQASRIYKIGKNVIKRIR